MDLFCARAPQLVQPSLRRRAPDDRIVHHDHALASDNVLHQVQLDLDARLPGIGRGHDERAANVMVADEPSIERYAGHLGVAHRGGPARVGHRDNNVRVGGPLLGEFSAESHPYPVNVLAEHVAVRSREIDVLEYALRQPPGRVLAKRLAAQAVLVHNDEFARLYVPDVVGVHNVQRAGLAGDNRCVAVPADAQRPEPVRVARGHQTVFRQEQETERALEVAETVRQAVLESPVLGIRKQVDDDLAVRARLKDRAPFLVLAAERPGIDEVTVMRDGQKPIDLLDNQRLDVLYPAGPRCRVAHVTDSGVAGKRAEIALFEHVGNKPRAFSAVKRPPVRRDNSRALLAAMLERVQTHIDARRRTCVAPDTDKAAVFLHVSSPLQALLDIHSGSSEFRSADPASNVQPNMIMPSCTRSVRHQSR